MIDEATREAGMSCGAGTGTCAQQERDGPSYRIGHIQEQATCLAQHAGFANNDLRRSRKLPIRGTSLEVNIVPPGTRTCCPRTDYKIDSTPHPGEGASEAAGCQPTGSAARSRCIAGS